MAEVDVVAVVGVCGPERLRYARELAADTGRLFVPASRLAMSPDPAGETTALVPWVTNAEGVVIEFPVGLPVTEIIGALSLDDNDAVLREVVCVADALHLVDDLRRDSYSHRRLTAEVTQSMAHSLLAATQLEFASTIALVNWEALSTPDLSTVMALVSHISPWARVHLRGDNDHRAAPGEHYGVGQARPGWVSLLSADFPPHMTDPRVSALRYENVRPLHPGRLQTLLHDRLEPGEFGSVIRSAGFCRLATRPHMVAHWEHVGCMISFEALAPDDEFGGSDDLLAVGEDIAFFGLDMDRLALIGALDEAVLTDEELIAGPAEWATFSDPFPAWNVARGPAQ